MRAAAGAMMEQQQQQQRSQRPGGGSSSSPADGKGGSSGQAAPTINFYAGRCSAGPLPELRPPPARYSAHASNLGPLPRVSKSPIPPAWPAEPGTSTSSSGGAAAAGAPACSCAVPRNSVLCQLLAASIALLLFVQAVSCGLFFCVSLPSHHSRAYVDYRDLVAELDSGSMAAGPAGGGSTAAAVTAAAAAQGSGSSGALGAAAAAAPKLIPRVIHQTYRSSRGLPAGARPLMRSWGERNGGDWQLRFYSDEAAAGFVRREYPEYYEAYMALPKDVERADFFRYMVVLRLGGVYADIDVECRAPLDGVIAPADTLLAGWEGEHADAHDAAVQQYARQRQVASWFFAAAPGHPVLRAACDHIARHALTVYSNSSVRDTQERTGQGLWTDLVVAHALQHPAAKHDDPWKVRILPRVAFGARPSDASALGPELPGVVVLHHFLGSWQSQASWHAAAPAHRKALQILAPLLPWARPSNAVSPLEPVAARNISLFPVSVSFSPPFTLMTHLAGAGDVQAGSDVAAAISEHGSWQPGVAPHRKPAVVEALVGALGRRSSAAANSPVGAGSGPVAAAAAASAAAAHAGADSSGGGGGRPLRHAAGVLVDVGAGSGFFSIAAAARGHRVIAFEAAPRSTAALRASIEYNGFDGLVELHEHTYLGAQPGSVCLQWAGEQGSSSSGGPVAAAGNSSSSSSGGGGDGGASVGSSRVQRQRRLAEREAALRRRRGFPHLADGAPGGGAGAGAACALQGRVQRLADVLANTTGLAALRVSAHGHEGWVLAGALPLLASPSRRPDVVYVEFCPAAMRSAGYSSPAGLLRQLVELGYADVAHAGRVCDKRWHNMTHALRAQGAFSQSAGLPALRQPTWCKLRPEHFSMLVAEADPVVPENLLFVLRHGHGQHANGSSSSSAGAGTATSGAAAGGEGAAAGEAHAASSSTAAGAAASSSGAGSAAGTGAQMRAAGTSSDGSSGGSQQQRSAGSNNGPAAAGSAGSSVPSAAASSP